MLGNIFRDLNDLPDEPRLGLRLIALGIVLEIIGGTWLRAFPGSYKKANTSFVAYTGWITARRRSPLSIHEALLIAGLMAIVCGAFIFCRKGWWWWAEHRDVRDITQIDLK